MSLTIKREKDNRVMKCILHRVADIPGGVTVKTASLGGSALLEGTPLAECSDGLFEVCKQARIVAAASATTKSYVVARGHHFKPGDLFAVGKSGGQRITAIDKINSEKDTITLATTLGAEVKVGEIAFEAASVGAATPKNTPVAIAGSNMDVQGGDNLFVDAWVIAVVRSSNAPAIDDAAKAALKGIIFV